MFIQRWVVVSLAVANLAIYATFADDAMTSTTALHPTKGQESLSARTSEPRRYSLYGTILWYLPNRCLDLLDIFRARLKVGPGVGMTLRVTDQAAFYAGNSSAAYIGLPGPRKGGPLRWPAGLERQRGIVLAGVDASDKLPYPQRYGYSEADVGVHLGIVGADGIDAYELADFLGGWFLLDLRTDDYPRTAPLEMPERETVVSSEFRSENDPLDPRQPRFPSLPSRLDYLKENVPRRLRGQLVSIDRTFAGEGQPLIEQPPMEELSFAFFVRSAFGRKTTIEFKPEAEIDIDLPNIERRLSLFIESASSDDLPGRDRLDREDNGFTVGARDKLSALHLRTDAGIRVKWFPELYARVSWTPEWNWGEWIHRFEQRFFWESEDGLGSRSSLSTFRWLNDNRWVFYNSAAARVTEKTDGCEWQETVAIGRIMKLFDESRRSEPIGRDDTIEGAYLSGTLFGNDATVTQYRTKLGHCQDFYGEFVVLDYAVGLQWREEDDWQTEVRFDIGVITYF